MVVAVVVGACELWCVCGGKLSSAHFSRDVLIRGSGALKVHLRPVRSTAFAWSGFKEENAYIHLNTFVSSFA